MVLFFLDNPTSLRCRNENRIENGKGTDAWAEKEKKVEPRIEGNDKLIGVHVGVMKYYRVEYWNIWKITENGNKNGRARG